MAAGLKNYSVRQSRAVRGAALRGAALRGAAVCSAAVRGGPKSPWRLMFLAAGLKKAFLGKTRAAPLRARRASRPLSPRPPQPAAPLPLAEPLPRRPGVRRVGGQEPRVRPELRPPGAPCCYRFVLLSLTGAKSLGGHWPVRPIRGPWARLPHSALQAPSPSAPPLRRPAQPIPRGAPCSPATQYLPGTAPCTSSKPGPPRF
jgi:hypothetical protein